jgi:dTDP-4-amino-4,6-dideoxygalactose transaminase
MWARKRIDIGWRDLLAGAVFALWPGSRAVAQRAAERTWPRSDDLIACLSVRSGLDLMLSQLALPPGSEVLISTVTIEDMATILRHHGLVPVPIDVNSADMSPRLDLIDQAVTPHTRALLIAHLFGARLPMTEFVEKARAAGLRLWEDCAQAFDGRYAGHPEADVSMFSFGPIKTATALGGGLLRVRDHKLLARMRQAQAAWPQQTERTSLARVARYAVLKCLSGRIAFGVFIASLRWRGRDPDQVLSSAVRNFPGDELLAQLRYQPATAMLRLLARRLRTFRTTRLDRRTMLGRKLATQLAHVVECPGAAATEHSFWVFPICGGDSVSHLPTLRAAGFDASAASQLRAVSCAEGSFHTTTQAVRITSESCFLPLYPELTEPEVDRLAKVLTTLRKNTETPRVAAVCESFMTYQGAAAK